MFERHARKNSVRLLLLAFSATAAASSPRASFHRSGDTVTLGHSTLLTIQNSIQPNQIPTFSLFNSAQQTALKIRMGTTNHELFEMPDADGAPSPAVSSFYVKGPTSMFDVLIPIVMVTGGSDCGYDATVVG
ncbi:MAG: hypothetical protein ABI142_05105, partial [Bryocella sp.]